MSAEPLKGWKAIASFLDVSVRTASRWERELALPVHRLAGLKGDVVYAQPEELRRWLEERSDVASETDPVVPSDEPDAVPSEAGSAPGRRFRGSRPVLAFYAGLAVLLATAALYWLGGGSPTVASSQPLGRRGGQSTTVTAETTSERLLLLRVLVETVTGSQRLSLGVFDGGMVTVATKGGPSLGILARRAGSQVTILVGLLSGTIAGPGGGLHQIGTLHLDPGRPVSVSHEGTTLRVEWTGERPARPPAVESNSERTRECTIRCDRLAVTGAAVETPCGKCCDPTACAPAF